MIRSPLELYSPRNYTKRKIVGSDRTVFIKRGPTNLGLSFFTVSPLLKTLRQDSLLESLENRPESESPPPPNSGKQGSESSSMCHRVEISLLLSGGDQANVFYHVKRERREMDK